MTAPVKNVERVIIQKLKLRKIIFRRWAMGISPSPGTGCDKPTVGTGGQPFSSGLSRMTSQQARASNRERRPIPTNAIRHPVARTR
jgi:hypothetical protein